MQSVSANAPGTGKVRRLTMGSKAPEGHLLQRDGRRIRRPNVRRIRSGKPDPKVTGVGGLVAFNAFLQRVAFGRELRRRFCHLKDSPRVVYPMAAQMQLFIDAVVAGASRVFGLEMLAADPVFRHLAGGHVPSVDTVYDDLQRFDVDDLESLEELCAEQAAALVRDRGLSLQEEFLDIDTTVTPVFGHREEARRGPNPHFHGRDSYHPILGRLATVGAVVAARLRPGDTSFGEADVDDIRVAVRRAHRALGDDTIITVRIDSAGCCAEIMKGIAEEGAFFIIKSKKDAALLGAIGAIKRWQTIDSDADGKPSRQVAVLEEFRREGWPEDSERRFRVIIMRTNERPSGEQLRLWDDNDLSVHAYVTNDLHRDPDDIARAYDGRAGIEPVIGELKSGLAIGKHSNTSFAANEAAFLLKVLAYNLIRRFVASTSPMLADWRIHWIRRVMIAIPGRLLRAEGRYELRLAPRPMLN